MQRCRPEGARRAPRTAGAGDGRRGAGRSGGRAGWGRSGEERGPRVTHNSPADVVRRGGGRRGRFLPRQAQGEHEEHLPAAGAGPTGGAQHPLAPRAAPRRPPRQGPAPAPRWAPPDRRAPRRIRAPAPGLRPPPGVGGLRSAGNAPRRSAPPGCSALTSPRRAPRSGQLAAGAERSAARRLPLPPGAAATPRLRPCTSAGGGEAPRRREEEGRGGGRGGRRMLMRRAGPALRLGGRGAAPSGRGAAKHRRRGATAPHRQRVPPRLCAALLSERRNSCQPLKEQPRSRCRPGIVRIGRPRSPRGAPRWDGADGCSHPDGPAAAISEANAADTSQPRPLLPMNTLLYPTALEIASKVALERIL